MKAERHAGTTIIFARGDSRQGKRLLDPEQRSPRTDRGDPIEHLRGLQTLFLATLAYQGYWLYSQVKQNPGPYFDKSKADDETTRRPDEKSP